MIVEVLENGECSHWMWCPGAKVDPLAVLSFAVEILRSIRPEEEPGELTVCERLRKDQRLRLKDQAGVERTVEEWEAWFQGRTDFLYLYLAE